MLQMRLLAKPNVSLWREGGGEGGRPPVFVMLIKCQSE